MTTNVFQLSTVQALQSHKIFDSGVTQPQLIEGICFSTQTRKQCVVKYMAGSGMSPLAAAKELLGVFLARQLGLCTPDPVLVKITPEFANSITGGPTHPAQNSLGLNYGSIYLEGTLPVSQDKDMASMQQMQHAFHIFAFDIFISNVDRTARKPNMFTVKELIHLFDHEKAFSFLELLSFLRSKTPWIIDSKDMTWIQNHFFYPKLKNISMHPMTFISSFIDALDTITPAFWAKVRQYIPSDWLEDKRFEEIQTVLNNIIEHKDDFGKELERILQ